MGSSPPEIYCLRQDGRTVVYAPLAGLALLGNEDLVSWFAAYQAGQLTDVPPPLQPFVARIEGEPFRPGCSADNGEWRPTRVTLFLTSD